ncbi:MAG: GDP-mannose 4,6-dehydratase [Atopobium sp.]|uniref:dTDP-glucose 4,6-dehydratase n=1 Tax=Atopobium sp. TaxID=1872650 RepID=UPI002A761D1D|nr:GDP-mannose 4,6-dehydratase [Atopobium sp.]MDY2788887.1 GDP-mannose 4,6-dehydratase [Atopobium sp.]
MEAQTTPTYFVTGGAGFIGSHLTRALLSMQPTPHVVVLDAFTYAGNPENLLDIVQDSYTASQLYVAQVDICDSSSLHKLFAHFTPRMVFHLAAESHVDRSFVDAAAFERTNVMGTQTVATCVRELAQSGSPCRMLHVSTDEVYGSIPVGDAPVDEAYPCAPTSPYSQSKFVAEKIIQTELTRGLDAVIVRCCNAFGSYQFPEKLIPVVISKALHHEPIPVYGTGLQTREWMLVTDHVAGIRAAAHHGSTGHVYNLSSGKEIANLTLAKMLVHELSALMHDATISNNLICHVSDRQNHDVRYASNASKAAQELGWKAQHDVQTNLLSTVHWYAQHTAWLEHISNKSYCTTGVQQLKTLLGSRWIDSKLL